MDRRKNPRFAVDYRCAYFGEHFSGEGRVLDLSKEGARLCSGASVAKGDYLKMVIALPNRNGLLCVELATTRWSRGREFGVEFIRMDPEQQRRLQDCLQGFAVEESPAVLSVSEKMTMANRRNRMPREILIARFPTYRSLGAVAAVMLAILLGLDVSNGSAKQGRRDQFVPILGISTPSAGTVVYVHVSFADRADHAGMRLQFRTASGRLSRMAQTSTEQAVHHTARRAPWGYRRSLGR